MLALGLLLFTTGCTTVDHGGAQAFSTGVTAARAQTKTAFDAVVTLTRASAVDYAVTQDRLKDEYLKETPDAAAIAAWNEALDPIESYAQRLSSLTAPDAAKGVEDSVGALAAQFNTTATKIDQPGKITAGTASAFAEVASALLRARGEKEALGVAAKTDESIRKVLTALADVIGKDNTTPGLRATVRANWEQQLGDLKAKFADVGSSGTTDKAALAERRRPIVTDYIDRLNKRDAQDELLAALRRTYLTLADAHTALAKGHSTDLGGAIDYITAELKHARDLQDQFTKTLSK